MKFLKIRVLPLFLVFVLSVSLLVVPASASGTFPDDLYDGYSVGDWNAQMNAGPSITLSAIASYFGIDADPRDVFWHLVDGRIGQCYGEVGLGELEALAESFNQAFNTPAHEYFILQAVDGVATIYKDTFAQCTIGTLSPNFKVTFDVARNVYRIIETNTSIYVVDSAGRYPYVEDDGEYLGTDQWLPISAMDGGIYRMLSKESIYNLADDVGGTVYTRGNYLCITKAASSPLVDKMVLANEDGKPYVCWKDKNQSATEQERPTTNVTENGNIVEGDDNSVNLDLEGMTMLLPGGTLAFIDQIIYDESTKSYHIDSHDTYNYEINNYYTWNYYINYTSITYIGQTEEYNKYYEVYYELPDGRSSADLTKEDLEQLNLSVDVIPYGRSADDTSLRSLYHFDGDTKDSSYWNYCTDFTWYKGASLTYMDAGVFDGALYLDETEHKFSVDLPSNIGSGDFTLQFRYYQSHTAAPVTDSYVDIGGNVLVQFDGANLKTHDGTVISQMPVGSWNEIAVIRCGQYLRIYLNGVPCSSTNYLNTVGLNSLITFHFGSEQQTFKYFDELRILDYALINGGSYTPSSVPHDTNLTLVLPDSAVPVADEYWNITSSGENLLGCTLEDFTSPTFPSWWKPYPISANDRFFPNWTDSDSTHCAGDPPIYGSLEAYSGFLRLTNNNLSSMSYSSTYGFRAPLQCFIHNGSTYEFLTLNKKYTFSVVLADGSVNSVTFTYGATSDKKVTFDWGVMGYEHAEGAEQFLGVCPTKGTSIDIVYMELVPGSSTDLTAEWVESVTAIDKEDLNTPTLAVRTDFDITSYQIGGVRPSLPKKGMVWAMVENERITSLQVYNGQAWEGVDGRIWTGERWIPMNSYNIITLQDLYDIVDATPNYEYIYSEAGFWSWWQKSWNAFQERLFQALGSGGSGSSGASGGAGSSELGKIDLDSESVVSDPDLEAGKTLWQFIVLVVDGGKSVVAGTRELFSGVISTIPESMDEITDAFYPGGVAVGVLDGTSLDPDNPVESYSVNEGEVLDPWRYR